MPLSKHDVTHLARECLNEHNGWNFPDWVSAAQKLARAILSGTHKREIENAAFERAELIALRRRDEWRQAQAKHTTDGNPATAEYARAKADEADFMACRIRALIQPPAQQESVE